MKHTPISPNNSLAKAYTDQRAVEARIRDFVPMVRKAAWHIYGSGRDGLEIEDLIQVGMMALTEAARRHDRDGEDGFAAYAKMRVRGAMFDTLRKMAPDSRGLMKRRRELEQAREKYSSLNGRLPSIAELAVLLDLDEAQILAMDQEGVRMVPIDASYDESSIDFADDEPDALMAMVAQENSAALAEAIASLPERLQLVLQLYFVEELNLAEIAETLDVSVPRVHQLKASAIEKLREALIE